MLLLSRGVKITLPKYETIEERIKFAGDIILEHPDLFEFIDIPEQDRLVSIRLDVLGTYILQADNEKEKDILTRYKTKARAKTEIPFSNHRNSEHFEAKDKIL